jgi:hypothetical protein
MKKITKKLMTISQTRNIKKINYRTPRGKKASIFIDSNE